MAEKQMNSLLSGAMPNFLEDHPSATMIVPVADTPITPMSFIEPSNLEAMTTEIDLNEPGHTPFIGGDYIPDNMPQDAASMFQSPPTPSSVLLLTEDQGQYSQMYNHTVPTQSINSPYISADSYSSFGSEQYALETNISMQQTLDNGNTNSSSTYSSVKNSFTTIVSSLTSSFSSFGGWSAAYSDPVRTNTATTAGVGQSEITNVVPSSYVSAQQPQPTPHKRVPEPFGALETPPPSSTNVSANSFRMNNQRPVYAQYPGLINSPTAPTSSVPPPSFHSEASSPQFGPPPMNSTNQPPYNDSTDPGSAYNFGAPIPMHTPYGADTYVYQPVVHHWFYKKEVDGRFSWRPFSLMDSVALEEAYAAQSTSPVATDGGRHDVYVLERVRKSVYWDEDPTEVRRCSWFYKGPMDSRAVPYEEEFSSKLEEEFYNVVTTSSWHRRLQFPAGEAIVFHSTQTMVHFCKEASPDEWGSVPESQLRPRVVKRGVTEDFEIQDGESSRIDHLVFLVHGIGAICDFKFRCIDEAVDGFRNLSFNLMQTHFKEATEAGLAGRIEFLPVSWHRALHGDRGVDEQLKKLTLPSIPKLRHFTNDTLLDILFYTSPKYCQTVIKTVGNEMNKLYNLFLSRNKQFCGKVAVGGHSLGSLILFDLLSHQPSADNKNVVNSVSSAAESVVSLSKINVMSVDSAVENLAASNSDVIVPHPGSTPRMVSFSLGAAGTGQPFIVYPILDFHPTAFFAMGSPTAMFVTVRGLEKLGEDFHLPTCPSYFNIFHPYDPVAYRIEPLLMENFDPEPILIPHHKGRKRLHLEFKDKLVRVGVDFKSKVVDSVWNVFTSVYEYAAGRPGDPTTHETTHESTHVPERTEQQLEGETRPYRLNGGRRIDYILQEAPVESINEYLFALSSHVCYWESEDTMLMIMKEIYNSLGVHEDSTYGGNNHPQSNDPYIGPAAKVLMKEENFGGCETPVKSVANSKKFSDPCLTDSHQPTAPSAVTFDGTTAPQAPGFNQHVPLSAPPSQMIMPSLTPPLHSHSQGEIFMFNPISETQPALPPLQPFPMPGVVGEGADPTSGGGTMGMDPTAPPSHTTIGPPPLAGFQRRN